MTDILLLRMLLGLAEAVGPIASLSLIRRNFHGAELGLPTAIYIAGQNVGPATGALLGTRADRKTRMARHVRHHRPGSAAVASGLVMAGAARCPQQTVEKEHRPPLPWLGAVASPAFWAMSLSIFLSSYFWYFLLTWVPAYLTLSRGFSNLEMGRVLSAPLFTMAVLNIAVGVIADRLIPRVGSVFKVRVWLSAAGYLLSGSILLLLILPGREAVLPILMVSVCATGIGNSNYWALCAAHLACGNGGTDYRLPEHHRSARRRCCSADYGLDSWTAETVRGRADDSRHLPDSRRGVPGVDGARWSRACEEGYVEQYGNRGGQFLTLTDRRR